MKHTIWFYPSDLQKKFALGCGGVLFILTSFFVLLTNHMLLGAGVCTGITLLVITCVILDPSKQCIEFTLTNSGELESILISKGSRRNREKLFLYDVESCREIQFYRKSLCHDIFSDCDIVAGKYRGYRFAALGTAKNKKAFEIIVNIQARKNGT